MWSCALTTSMLYMEMTVEWLFSPAALPKTPHLHNVVLCTHHQHVVHADDSGVALLQLLLVGGGLHVLAEESGKVVQLLGVRLHVAAGKEGGAYKERCEV